MPSIPFYKYQGTGNDFVMIDNRSLSFSKNDTKLIARMCDRKFGIGADGLILLEHHATADFTMVYFNADGNESTMCGNGGRCLVAFAQFLEVIKDTATFEAIDGMHHATISNDGIVSLQMSDVDQVHDKQEYLFTDTGSPHHVQLVQDIDHYEVVSSGKQLRHDVYGTAGANINFVEPIEQNIFKVRTYERGVEDETLSCGTGVTAVALAMHHSKKTTATHVELKTLGGNLQVRFEPSERGYKNIWLIGPAQQVFKGTFTI